MLEVIMQTNALQKKYRDYFALDSVSINVMKGDIYGLLGRNGAGKTTLIRLISGLINKDGGEISLFSNKDFKREIHRVGFVIERPFLYLNNTAKENLKLYCLLTGTNTKRINDVLNIVGLNELESKKKVGAYSFGMKQRLSIATALIPLPELLILDEPLNGLDPMGIHDFRDLLLTLNKEHGITIVISSHILEELSKVANRYGILETGKMIGEFSFDDIKSIKQYVKYTVNDVELSKNILINMFGIKKIEIIDKNVLKVFEGSDILPQINKTLIKNGVELINVTTVQEDLEEYFLKIVNKVEIK